MNCITSEDGTWRYRRGKKNTWRKSLGAIRRRAQLRGARAHHLEKEWAGCTWHERSKTSGCPAPIVYLTQSDVFRRYRPADRVELSGELKLPWSGALRPPLPAPRRLLVPPPRKGCCSSRDRSSWTPCRVINQWRRIHEQKNSKVSNW